MEGKRAERASSYGAASLEAYRARLSRALAYIQEHLGDELSLDGAAAAACFSKFHFHRIFGAALGESFADYVRRLRLERAAAFLEQRPEMPVTEVSMASGFGSSSVLSRLFSQHFGSPPSRWREERLAAARAMSRAAAPSGKEPRSYELWARVGSERRREALRAQAMPALRFASCLHIGAYGPGIQRAWDRLYKWAGPRGLISPGMPSAGISWDNPELCPADRCRYSACIPIPDGLETSGEITVVTFPARSYLCLHCAGREVDFAAAYADLYRVYLPESGFEPEDDPAIEFYRRPADADRGFDLDIALPVRPLG